LLSVCTLLAGACFVMAQDPAGRQSSYGPELDAQLLPPLEARGATGQQPVQSKKDQSVPDAVPSAPQTAFGPQPANSRGWVSAEYLLWWFKKSPEPVPLVTMGAVTDIPPGALGQPFTQTVLGGSSINPEEHSGGRFAAGYWLDSEQTFAVEVSYLFLSPHVVSQSVASRGQPGLPALFIPFDNVTPTPIFDLPFSTGGGERGLFLALPAAYAGSATLSYSSRLQGAELTGTANLVDGGRFRLDLVGGFRWLELHEDLTFSTFSNNVPGFGPAGLFINTRDQFATGNDFFGGQLGVRGEFRLERFVLSAAAKVALGDMSEVVNINGSSVTNLASTVGLGTVGPTVVSPSGIFAEPSNIGRHLTSRFAVVPEANVNVGFDLSAAIRIFAGYSFLYMSDVARPGNQIDRTLNFSQSQNLALGFGALTGPARPAFSAGESGFWAQGLNFGLQFRY